MRNQKFNPVQFNQLKQVSIGNNSILLINVQEWTEAFQELLAHYYELEPDRHLAVLHRAQSPTLLVRYAQPTTKKRFRWSKGQHELFVQLVGQGIKGAFIQLIMTAVRAVIDRACRLPGDGGADR